MNVNVYLPILITSVRSTRRPQARDGANADNELEASAEPANPMFLVWGQRISQNNYPASVLLSGKSEAALERVKTMSLRDLPLRIDESTDGLAFLRTLMRWRLTSVKLGIKAQQLILLIHCEQDGSVECHRKRIGSSG
jgi:hypothetical protein